MNSSRNVKRSILYIAYLYPPVGGLGLPGAQRTVKFVNHLECSTSHVLTVKTPSYPAHTTLDNNISVPVNQETIHRTGILDIFELLLKLKNILKKKREYKATRQKNNLPLTRTTTATDLWYGNKKRSNWMKLKDFVSDLFRFPDSVSSWIIPAVYRGQKIVRERGITVILATGAPWSALYIAYWVGKLRKVPYIVDFRDPWIDNPFHVSKGRFLDGLAVKLERTIVTNASLVTVNTEELCRSFVNRYPELESAKFITVTNGYSSMDYDHVDPSKENTHWDNSANTIVFAHAGFLYGTRDPGPIIEAIKIFNELSDKKATAIFVQIGAISLGYDFYERYAEMLDAKEIVVIDQVPFQDCLQIMSNADVLLNIQPKTATQVPSKLYDYLCLDLPILNITPLNGALGNMVQKYGFGDVHEPEDVEGIANSISKHWNHKRQRGTLKSAYANKEKFDIKCISNKLSISLSERGL